METRGDAAGEAFFRLHRVHPGGQRFVQQNVVVARHQLVADAHELPKHRRRRVGERDIVAEALAHFLMSVEPLEDRHRHRDLAGHALFVLKIAADHDVEKLVGAAEFHIGFDHHGVPALHDRVLDFVGADGLAFVEPVAEILAHEHLLKGHSAVELDDLLEAHALEPLAVENNRRPLAIENFEGLLLETFGIRQNLGVGELRAGDRAAGGVADHGGEVADDQDRVVPLILKIAELRKRDAVAEVDIRRGGIDAEFDAERAAELQLLGEFLLADDLCATPEKK